MSVLGVCPVCGGDVMSGKFGPWCKNKCGFKMWPKLYGKELTEEEESAILSGDEILLRGLKTKSGATYDMYVRASGIKENKYTAKDGGVRSSYELEFKTAYPDNDVGYNNFIGYFRNT